MKTRNISGVMWFLLVMLVQWPIPPVVAQGISLEECVNIAIGKNPVIGSAHGRTQSLQRNVAVARSAFSPSVSLRASGNRNEAPMFLPSEFKAFSGKNTFSETRNSYLTQANVSMTIADGGLRKSTVKVAESGVDASLEEERSVQQQLVLRVHEAFFQLVAANQNQKVAVRNLDRSKNHLAMAEARHSVGDVALVDVLRAKVQVADAKLLLVRVENSVSLAKGALNVAMGNTPEVPIEISESIGTIPTPDSLNYSSLTASATASHPRIQALRQKNIQAERKISQFRAADRPQVNAVGAYGKQDLEFFPKENNWVVGLEANWVAFDGGARREQIAKGMADLSVSASELRTAILNLQMEIWAAFQSVLESFSSFEAAQELAKEAEESLRIIQVRYQAGSGTITDLLDAQTAQSKADFSVVETGIQRHLAYSRLLYSCGRLE